MAQTAQEQVQGLDDRIEALRRMAKDVADAPILSKAKAAEDLAIAMIDAIEALAEKVSANG